MTVDTLRARVDPLGALLVAIGTLALVVLPVLLFKPNRILPGEARALAEALAPAFVIAFHGALALAAWSALVSRNPWIRLACAIVALAVVAAAVGAAATALTPPGNRVVRVAPGGAFWILVVALGLLAADAIARLRPGPLARVGLLALTIVASLAALQSGWFDDLSILREHAVNAERFAREVRQHLRLTFGSLAAALVAALPLAVVCHRRTRLQAGVLGVLNVVQTIPSIALFGILMAPLAALGLGGIGAAPAVVALFLYSLLPIVGNTVVGLARVEPAVVDAARGMGLTPAQTLWQVELPLALPAIIAGVRIVLVQNIGLVTIAALIGGGGLGAFVFQGIGQTAIDLVLLGALPTVALAFAAAVVLDACSELTRRVPR